MSDKVAITTSDRLNVNLHFGQVDAFCIYELSEQKGAQFIGIRKIPEEWIDTYRQEIQAKGCSQKGKGYIALVAGMLEDCKYLLTEKIGSYPYKVIQSKGISCLEISCPIAEALEKISLYQSKVSTNIKKHGKGEIKVAAASTDGRMVNQHFGQAEQFCIIKLTEENYEFLETRNVYAGCIGEKHKAENFENTARILEDCAVILVSRAGPGAYDFLTRRGFKVIEVSGVITEILEEIFYTQAKG